MTAFINVLFIGLTIIDLSQSVLTHRSDDNGGYIFSKTERWGAWNNWVFCDEGQWARSYAFRSEADQGDHLDDVGGVAVRLICERPGSLIEYPIEADPTQPGKGWGSWYGVKDIAGSATTCGNNAWLVGYRSKVEEAYSGCSCSFTCPSGCVPFDDAAMTCMQMLCSDGMILEPTDCRSWGSWGAWSRCSTGYICGFREKFEEDQGLDDETGLNGVSFKCCDYTASPTQYPTPSPTPRPTPRPTQSPTPRPTNRPTERPTISPTEFPTNQPTDNPSATPTKSPTDYPSLSPSINPSKYPTKNPSVSPSDAATEIFTETPTQSPTATPIQAQKVEDPQVTQIIHVPVPVQVQDDNSAAMGGLIGALVFLVLCLCCLGLLLAAYLWKKNKKMDNEVEDVQHGESVSVVSTVPSIIPIEGSNTTGIQKNMTPHGGTPNGYDALKQNENINTMIATSSNKKEKLTLLADHSSDDDEFDMVYNRDNPINKSDAHSYNVVDDDEDEDVLPRDDDDDILR